MIEMDDMQGIVRGVMLMEPGKSPVSTLQEALRITRAGIVGDSHAGLTINSGGKEKPNTRQVSLVSVEELAEVAKALDVPKLNPEWIGANLMIEGIPDLSKLPPGARLLFPREEVLIVAEENTPCSSAGRAVQRMYPDRPQLSSLFPKAALGKRGLLLWVDQPGEIRIGDRVRAQLLTGS